VQQGWGQPPRPQCTCRRQGAPARVQQRAGVYAAEVGAQQARAGVKRGQRGRRAVRMRCARRRALVQHQHVRKLDLSRAPTVGAGRGPPGHAAAQPALLVRSRAHVQRPVQRSPCARPDAMAAAAAGGARRARRTAGSPLASPPRGAVRCPAQDAAPASLG